MSEFKLYTSQFAHRILGVTKSASEDEIRAAYKVLALQSHPDKVDEADREAATQRFQEIQAAYEHCVAYPSVGGAAPSTTSHNFNHHAAKSSRAQQKEPSWDAREAREARWRNVRERNPNFHPHPEEERENDANAKFKSEISEVYRVPHVGHAPVFSTAPKWAQAEDSYDELPTNTWRDDHSANHNAKVTPQQRLHLFKKQTKALEQRVPTFGIELKKESVQERKEKQRQAVEKELTKAVKRAEAVKAKSKSTHPPADNAKEKVAPIGSTVPFWSLFVQEE
ncbi:DnaJ-domain-containing protein [Plenodomus tracheiphilus IPT5]|uniref:DnaJ-domain-containing protein n=1 Tax=Plenodomus tracheiphilus IPT5 TaxID=1408161 RepID=A0A6A7B4M7_9PLEO|nr:DnaJ-domain-containing protein [Plenodomus tracheiphilus IPT5]